MSVGKSDVTGQKCFGRYFGRHILRMSRRGGDLVKAILFCKFSIPGGKIQTGQRTLQSITPHVCFIFEESRHWNKPSCNSFAIYYILWCRFATQKIHNLTLKITIRKSKIIINEEIAFVVKKIEKWVLKFNIDGYFYYPFFLLSYHSYFSFHFDY